MLKKVFYAALLFSMGMIMASCIGNTPAAPPEDSDSDADTELQFNTSPSSASADSTNSPGNAGNTGPAGTVSGTVFGSDDLDLMQATSPQPGDTIAIIHTSMGDVTLRFFPEEAPLAYENFVTHARNGYYDGVIFHRILENFMIQGGDPEGTGAGGESIWGHGFGQEFSWNLRHFRGALAMAQTNVPNSIGSQFYIVHNYDFDSDMLPFLNEFHNQRDLLLGEKDGRDVYVRDFFTPDMVEAYRRYGGTLHLDIAFGMVMEGAGPGHTVFGQVIDGMDVVDAIAKVEVDPAGRPHEEVIIERVTVTTY